jgi:hypothetical protein
LLSLTSAQKGEDKGQKNKEILEYFKRKVGFPLNMLDPEFDNVIPNFLMTSTNSKEGSDDHCQISMDSELWEKSPPKNC